MGSPRRCCRRRAALVTITSNVDFYIAMRSVFAEYLKYTRAHGPSDHQHHLQFCHDRHVPNKCIRTESQRPPPTKTEVPRQPPSHKAPISYLCASSHFRQGPRRSRRRCFFEPAEPRVDAPNRRWQSSITAVAARSTRVVAGPIRGQPAVQQSHAD
ncbi:hypothetical protein G7046_g8726 [Stylonectria norvegica]|nr:hypothetical protein G7046_g8726 [Stylonectria norvegica]